MAPDQIYRITKAPATSFYSGTKTGAKHLIWSRTKNSESYILWQECQVRSQLFWNRLETTHLKCLAILTLQNWSTPCLSPSTHPLHISGASRQHNASCGHLPSLACIKSAMCSFIYFLFVWYLSDFLLTEQCSVAVALDQLVKEIPMRFCEWKLLYLNPSSHRACLKWSLWRW